MSAVDPRDDPIQTKFGPNVRAANAGLGLGLGGVFLREHLN